ncbi:MAG: Hsp20/alpha crystallin family protein [Leptolyngbyaceae cyanobacterium RM1_406_9]|nr:Hsp20/alpha crystallin family protein [Leptolyngbyaceae cyanobacterium RM1_406_9]
MSLIHWQPLKELDTLRHQMNRLFDELTHGEREIDQFPKLENALWGPAIELKETDTDLILKAVVPGIEAKDLDVHVSENAVSIAGEHREEKRTEEKGYFRSELQYGQFQRTVPLPVSVKHDQVQSEFKDGVLTLTLPKAESTRQNVTKIDLTTQEKARESVAQQRQHEEHLQETMRTRAAAEMKTPSSTSTQAEARESMVEQRQHEEHLQETMHQRAADNIGSTVAH